MKITEQLRSKDNPNSLAWALDHQEEICIFIDDELVFSVRDGEPEDNNLGRNFSDCYEVKSLLERVYKAGYDRGFTDGYNEKI